MRHIPENVNISVYNVESNGALHNYLKHINNYVCSEYFGPYDIVGKDQNGILNVDLEDIPFDQNSFDYVITTEVFEHIPRPYKAFEEIHRVLKKGGSHIFTVPFKSGYDDEIRATMNEKNEINHLMKPEYHGDPIRNEDGILVFTVFAGEMISKLERMGFKVTMNKRRNLVYGILGDENRVFTATKI
ncbi:MAG: class I SAM-dependent methyltransferase [Ferruginibacter sp.]